MLQETRLIMGMPITICIAEGGTGARSMAEAFGYFDAVDRRFSTYKADSEISAMNAGRLCRDAISAEMREVLALAEKTRLDSDGYFDIRRPDGSLDPSGIVKGWAVRNAADLLREAGHRDFFVDAGGDIQADGVNEDGEEWRTGIRNPFAEDEIIGAVRLSNRGIATSGNYARGRHIYNPRQPGDELDDIVSVTVIGADVLEADRFATAACAMGADGIYFIEETAGLEGLMVNAAGISTQTSGFGAFEIQ